MPLFPPLAWMVACTEPRLPDPVVDSVEPSFAYNAEDEPITIVGQHFWPQVTLDAGNRGAEVDRSYRAWLVGPGDFGTRHELVGVGIIDAEHLSATVEAELLPGSYGLTVEGPTGARGELAGSFVVTDEQAAGLDLDSPALEYSVAEYAPIEIALSDLDQQLVALPFEIAITAATSSGYGTVEVLPGTLANPTPTPDGDGLRGLLQDGIATVFVRPSTPDVVTVTARAWDPGSKVASDFTEVLFVPGDDRTIRLTLPLSSGVPAFVAGEPFDLVAEVVDQYGNAVADRTVVALGTLCSGWFDAEVEIAGVTVVEVTPRIATGPSCAEDHVTVESGPGPEVLSDPFTVDAGPTDHFLIPPLPSARQAGDVLNLLVQPEDQFANPSVWEGEVTLDDTVHGLVDTSCFPFTPDGLQFCTTTVTLAHPADEVVALGDDGTTGTSTPIAVTADDLAASAVVDASGPVAAGVPLPVEVRALDAWGNVMDAALLGDGAITVVDDLGEATCASTGFLLDGAATFACTLFTARADAVLIADLPAFGVGGSAAPIAVTNGPLAVVRFSGEAPVVAGEVLALTVVGEDAWANRYLVQTDPVLELADDTGTLSPATVTLAADGAALAAVVITAAGSTTVHASQAGAWLGSSAPILVGPGPTSGLALTTLAPWAWVDEPVDVQVETVDEYGNRTDLAGAATLTSTTTAAAPVPVSLVNGVGTVAFTWPEAAFVDVLQGDLGAFTGTAEVVVSRDCGANGPVAELSFGGFPEAIACVDPTTGVAAIVADLSASVAGLRPITGWAAARLGGPTVADSQPILALELPGTGAYTVVGLAVANNGCAAERAANGWAGPDDDTPVGPIALSTLAVDVPVSTLPGAPIAIDVIGVVDCSRDPAAAQEIHLRTTAGTLLGPASSGVGPALVLDAAGDGVVDLETADHLSNGTVAVHAWVDSGAAGGLLTLPLVGDSLLPIVVGQDPAGVTGALVTEISLTFSEPMLTASVVDELNWAVTGPSPVTVLSAVSTGTGATLTLDPPADGALGLWTVTASQQRDTAGNRLAGDWGAVPATYAGAFGGFGGPPADIACTAFDPAVLVIRPDGDDGPDAEAETLEVTLSSAAAPAWWVVEVTDAAGTLAHLDWIVPLGSVDTVAWDGRGLDGTVSPNGSYEIEIRPDDGFGNRGEGCAFDVTIDNRVGATP